MEAVQKVSRGALPLARLPLWFEQARDNAESRIDLPSTVP
jgi:hypothetical protein